jgi:lipopolysaccharide export system permease protein
MPLLWRYLIGQFIKIFSLSISAFTLLLIVSRLHETASFAALGAPLKTLFFFTLFQFPYILPIAIPISCLIASLLLMQKLSRNYEIVAFFSCGLSLKKLLSPLFAIAVFLSLFNFYIASEVATNARLSSKKMIQDLSSLNPLTLLNNAHFLKRKDCFIKVGTSLGISKCKNVIIALRRQDDSRSTLFMSKELQLKDQELQGFQSTFIYSLPNTHESFDHLLIENQNQIKTPAMEFTHLLKKSPWKLCPDHLKMSLLLTKLKQEKLLYPQKSQDRYLSEISRRLQLGATPFAFTLMGLGFGLEISRRSVKKGVLSVSFLAALTFACFFLGKSSDHNFFLSTFLYFLPITLVILASLFSLRKIVRGVDR